MFKNNTFVKNFIPSNYLRDILKVKKYLTPQTALKPMHLVINQDADLDDEVIRFAIKVMPRQVLRGRHIYNMCNSNICGDADIITDEGQGDERIDVDFLHIFLNKPRVVFETTPNLYITKVFHGRRIDHYSYDPMPDSNIILCKFECESGIRKLHTVYLHTANWQCPKFIVHANRYGKIEVAA